MTEYKIKLDVFEGPLDLLLHLIKEQELNIYDIPIAKITKQYFEYLDVMKELNLEIAGEFLVMAATLTYIKSRMLLPKPPADEEEDGVDPRDELVRKLLEYKKFKEAARELRDKESVQSSTFSRGFISEWDENDADYLKEVTVFQLLSAFNGVLKRSQLEKVYEVTLENISITERISEVMERLGETSKLKFEDLFDEAGTKVELIATFLALLELMKQWIIRVFQERELGPIWVQKIDETKDEVLSE